MTPESRTKSERTTTVVSARFDTTTAERLGEDEMKAKVQARHPTEAIKDRADVVRTLVREGLATYDDGRVRLHAKKALPRAEYAVRAAGLVEALGDLLERMEAHDADGAVQLSALLAKTMTNYTTDLKKRVKK